MRITGGTLCGRIIETPPGVIRPAMDRMRESVFAHLETSSGLAGSSFLDLFSGSGIMSLEAASRGAARIMAVEADRGKADVLLRNVKMAPLRVECRFISAELFVMRAKERFDYIFCDPPFPYAHKWDLLARIAASPLMDGSTLLMLHRPRQDFCDNVEERCGLCSQRKSEYGRSIVEYFTKKG